MKLAQLTEKEKDRYQSFVQTNGYFLQDWDWGDFQISTGKKVLRFWLEEDGAILVTTQIIVSEIKKKKYFFAPYGPVVSNEKRDQALDLIKAMFSLLESAYPDIVFVRLESQLPLDIHLKGFKKSLDLNPHKTLLTDISRSEEELLASMHPKTRYNIRLAGKKGVRVEKSDAISEDRNLFVETNKRQGVSGYDLSYYNGILAFFKEGKSIKAELYNAWHNSDLLASNIMLDWNGIRIYLFGGSSDLKRNLMPTYLLHWQAIKDAKQTGLQKYDWWGVEEDPNHPWYGFSKFKLGFGGVVVKYGGTWDYILHPAWYNVYKLVRKINRIIR